MNKGTPDTRRYLDDWPRDHSGRPATADEFRDLLTGVLAQTEYNDREHEARAAWSTQATPEQRDEAARRFKDRDVQVRRMERVRAKNNVGAMFALASQPATITRVAARRPAAARTRRERPRARRTTPSRDGPDDGDGEPPPPLRAGAALTPPSAR